MKRVIIFLWLICFGSFAFSQGASAETTLPQSLTVKNSRGISYLSGGVGEEERAALQALGQTYSLKLIFAEKEGNYLSDVVINIRDRSENKIFEAVADGPWFFALLPPGQYYITATRQGVTQQQRIHLTTAKQRQLAFYW